MVKKIFCLLVVGSLLTVFFGINNFSQGEDLRSSGYFTMEDALRVGKGRIMGTILDRKGAPVEGVSITAEAMEADDHEDSLLSAYSTFGPVTTNSKGKFRIRRVPAGSYRVLATPPVGSNLLSNDDFNVVVFARKSAIADMTLSAKAPDGAGYSGSDSCKACHGGDHSGWLKTAHAKTHLAPTENTIVAPFDEATRLTSDGKAKFNAFISGDDYKVTLFDLNDETVTTTYSVERTHGGVAHAGKQRYHVKLDESHYILPIQYNHRNVDADDPEAAWVSYHAERWYNEDGTLREPDVEKHSYEQNCQGCHATGLNISKSGSAFVSSSTEIGIGCESCHGPGSVHASTGGGNGNAIINPDFLTVERGNQICGQCHTRVVSKPGDNGANFETGYPAIVDGDDIMHYVAGNDLNDYISLTKLSGDATPGMWGDDDESFGDAASKNNHSKKHHQQIFDFQKSHHYNAVGLTCYSCHKPHKNTISPLLRKENDDNSLCLSCHPSKEEMGVELATGKALNIHSKHVWDPEGSKASRCSGCHMPKTAKTAVYTDIHSHVFDIIKPAVSLEMSEKNEAAGVESGASNVIMNACFSCHPDKDYGAGRWLAWENKVVE